MKLCLQARSRKCTYGSFFSTAGSSHPAKGSNQTFRNFFYLHKSMGRKCELSVTSLFCFAFPGVTLGESTGEIISMPCPSMCPSTTSTTGACTQGWALPPETPIRTAVPPATGAVGTPALLLEKYNLLFGQLKSGTVLGMARATGTEDPCQHDVKIAGGSCASTHRLDGETARKIV